MLSSTNNGDIVEKAKLFNYKEAELVKDYKSLIQFHYLLRFFFVLPPDLFSFAFMNVVILIIYQGVPIVARTTTSHGSVRTSQTSRTAWLVRRAVVTAILRRIVSLAVQVC